VDLAVPLLPQMRTPPISGLIAARTRARRNACWPTIAVKGNGVCAATSGTLPGATRGRRWLSTPRVRPDRHGTGSGTGSVARVCGPGIGGVPLGPWLYGAHDRHGDAEPGGGPDPDLR